MSLQVSTFAKWKKTNKFLEIDSSNKIITYRVCKKWATKLPGTSAFITGSKNLKSSAVVDHERSRVHVHALRLEEEEQAKAENRKVRATIPAPSENSPISIAVGTWVVLEKKKKAVFRDSLILLTSLLSKAARSLTLQTS